MSLFRIFDVAGSATSAQSQRLNVVASNLANADTVAGPDGKAYAARHVVFATELMGARAGATSTRSVPGVLGRGMSELGGADATAGVRVSTVVEDAAPGRRTYDPKHPAADTNGYVTYSNVSAVEEMVNMIAASRSYQNNVEVMNTARTLMQKLLQMGA